MTVRNSVSMSVRGMKHTTTPTLLVDEVKALSAGVRLVSKRQKRTQGVPGTAINPESDRTTSLSK